jgi:hypothetical protein
MVFGMGKIMGYLTAQSQKYTGFQKAVSLSRRNVTCASEWPTAALFIVFQQAIA